MSSTGFLRAASLVLRKDLLVEWRCGEATITALLFGALVLVIGAFALADRYGGADGAGPVVYWLAVALSANLAVIRTWACEREDQALDLLRLAPIPPAAILAGKALALTACLLVIELALAVPAVVLFRIPVPGSALWLLPAALLATFGIAVVGSLFGAMVASGSRADLLVGVAVYPLLVPLFLGVVEVSQSALGGSGWAEVAGWTVLIAVFDVTVGTGAMWLFGSVLEE